MNRAKRRVVGGMLLAVATLNEGQSLVLLRLASQAAPDLLPKERKALQVAVQHNDKCVRYLRVLGNRMEQS